MRNLTKTLAVVSLLIPASGYPLGIGELKLHSALNQKLDAEVSLILSSDERLSEVKVNLAPPEKFDEAGVPWTYFLSKVKFEPKLANGSNIIKITSVEALKEPFLDILLEVSWAKGSLFREFTLLLDPPEVYRQATMPVMSSSANTGSDASTQRDRVRAENNLAPATSGAGEYGPTASNDTLWEIAERTSRGTGVTVEQMLMALYDNNPKAFYKPNVNALLAGKLLKIPRSETILKLSHKQAVNELNQQTRAWKHPQITEPALSNHQSVDEAPDNQLSLIAPGQDLIPENAKANSVKGQAATAEKTSNTTSPADPELTGVKTNKGTPIDGALEEKISALEKQLAVMQQLMALKDQQLAALQNQSQLKVTDKLTEQPANIEAPTDVSPKTVEPPVSKSKEETSSADLNPKPQPIAEPKPIPIPVPPKPVVKAIPPPPPAPLTDESDWYYLVAAGVGTGLLMLLGGLWWRQRQQEKGQAFELAFANTATLKAPNPGDIFANPESESALGLDLATEENIFASDFAIGDFDVVDVDQGEIDPISEADVYLAYGRYQQAEDLMRDAIMEQPDRDECKLKLLEIFYANNNKVAFETYASELISQGKQGDVVFWVKVIEMGSEICPNSSIFTSHYEVSQSYTSEGLAGNNDNTFDGMDFDLNSFEELFAKDSDEEIFGIKIDLLDEQALDESILELDKPANENNQLDSFESLDFDLSLFNDELKTEKTIPTIDKKINDKPEVKDLAYELDLSNDFNIDDNIDSLEITQATALTGETDLVAKVAGKTTISFDKKESVPFADLDQHSLDNPSLFDDFNIIEFTSSDTTNSIEKEKTNALSLGDTVLDDDFSALFADLSKPEESNTIEFTSEKIDHVDDLTALFTDSPVSKSPLLGTSSSLDKEIESLFGDFSGDSLSLEDNLSENYTSKDSLRDPLGENSIDSFANFDFTNDIDSIAKSPSNFGISNLDEMDEMETKLDLALAYIDMGDSASAKEIALEVLEKGTPEQKMVAQALLAENHDE
ncbi:MAG: fimbrial protein FimV [Methylovulum sp.]|nr:fimbrial protein FimV [Methylovulum sp.]